MLFDINCFAMSEQFTLLGLGFKQDYEELAPNICWGQNRSLRNQCRKVLKKMSIFKKEIIVKKIYITGKPKLSFARIMKRIHTISPQRKVTRILGQTDPERRNNETTIRLDHPTIRLDRPTRRTGELDRTSSLKRPFGELDQLIYLHPVLVAPSFEIGSNLLLFHLDRSHHWNFTI